MNCLMIGQQLGFQCKPINDGLVFVQSPLTYGFDGGLIGAYVQDIGNGRVRISDNADTLFAAMTHGVEPTFSRGKKLADMVSDCGMTLSDGGEIFATCNEEQAGYFLARFVEAAERVSFMCEGYRPQVLSSFEKLVSKSLKDAFGNRIKRNHKLMGASGHQLTFQFVMDIDATHPRCIQLVARNTDDKPNWSTVYQTIGKMTDLRNLNKTIRRTVVIEPGNPDETQQAVAALADTASVIIFESPGSLIQALAA